MLLVEAAGVELLTRPPVPALVAVVGASSSNAVLTEMLPHSCTMHKNKPDES